MSVTTAFEKARADERAALVGYLPAGFPTVEGGIEALRAMVDAGCDVIEVYDRRFDMKLTEQEKVDLTNFMSVL